MDEPALTRPAGKLLRFNAQPTNAGSVTLTNLVPGASNAFFRAVLLP